MAETEEQLKLPKLNVSDVSLASLKAFESTVRLGSGSKAAIELNVSNSSVAVHIARLEEKLGPLVIRNESGQLARGGRVTIEGKILADSLTNVLRELDQALARVREMRAHRLARRAKELSEQIDSLMVSEWWQVKKTPSEMIKVGEELLNDIASYGCSVPELDLEEVEGAMTALSLYLADVSSALERSITHPNQE